MAVVSLAVPPATADDRTTITLSANSQPALERPTLDAIKRSAEQKRITLAQAIDEYVARVVATDPSVTARAAKDGMDPIADPEIKIDDLWLSELTDMKVAAAGEGITLEEAIKRIGWQPRLNKVGAKLSERFPQEISGIKILEDGRKAQIGFKGKIPDEAVALAKTLPVTVELVGDKGFSQAELKQARDVAYNEVAAHKDEVEEVLGSYDTDTGVVDISVRSRVVPVDSAGRSGLLTRLQPKRPLNDKITINVSVSGKKLAVRTDNYMRGGGGIGTCTTGFNIVNWNDSNSRRTTTAAHCGKSGSKQYCNHPTQGGCTTSYYAGSSNVYDIGSWTRGSLTLTRTFYYNHNQARYVYDVGVSPYIGQNICSYGNARKDARCANVSQVDVSFSGAKGMIRMDKHIDIAGDSGGPWYKGNTAWGIHFGSCSPVDQAYTSCFTPAYDIPSALGTWEVWTAPPGT